jgi:hypothetical protein
MEQRELERKFGKKKAKEVAQQNFEVKFPKNRSMLKKNIILEESHTFLVSSTWVDIPLSSACIGEIYSIYSIRYMRHQEKKDKVQGKSYDS